jgi:putative two-component system response regulator
MAGDRNIIIMVDDDSISLAMGKAILEDRYILYLVPSAEKLFEMLKTVTPDLILLDVEMPVMDGYQTIRRLKENEITKEIPVIFLTAASSEGNELEGLNLGATDYVTKPFSPAIMAKRIENHLFIEAQKKELKRYNQNLREMVSVQTREIKNLQNGIINIVAEVVEFRSEASGGHIERTVSYLRVLIEALKKQGGAYKEEVAEWDEELVLSASQLHDVGKIYISEQILNKQSQLTPEEYDEIKNHPIYGLMLIEKITRVIGSNTFLKYASTLAETHHERWDGTGYPTGTKGINIPLMGRLMAIADVYDALVSLRPYKQPMSPSEAVEEIIKGSGTVFDPNLVDVFKSQAEEFARIAGRHDTLI